MKLVFILTVLQVFCFGLLTARPSFESESPTTEIPKTEEEDFNPDMGTCLLENVDGMVEQCSITTPWENEVILACLKDLKVEIPCEITNYLEGKSLKECALVNRTAEMEMEFSKAILSQCVSKCAFGKFDMLTTDGALDQTKMTNWLSSLKVVKDSGVKVSEIPKQFQTCMESDVGPFNANTTYDDNFNVTIGCPMLKRGIYCIVETLTKPMSVCINKACKSYMDSKTTTAAPSTPQPEEGFHSDLGTCFMENLDGLMEQCTFTTPAENEVILGCMKDLKVEIPCEITNYLEGKSLQECRHVNRSRETDMEFYKAFISQCPSKCALGKFDMLTEDGALDHTKLTKWISSIKIVQDSDMKLSEISKQFETCMDSNIGPYNINRTYDDNLNVTIGCPKLKHGIMCVGEVLTKPMGTCLNRACKSYMESKTTTTSAPTTVKPAPMWHKDIFTCYKDNLDGMLKRCQTTTPAENQIILGCIEDMNVEIPCYIKNYLEGKSVSACHYVNQSSETFLEFHKTAVSQCPGKCVWSKLDMVADDGTIDLNKVSAWLATVKIVKASGTNASEISTGLQECVNDTDGYFDDSQTFDEMLNVTIGCPEVKKVTFCVGKILRNPLQLCFNSVCQEFIEVKEHEKEVEEGKKRILEGKVNSEENEINGSKIKKRDAKQNNGDGSDSGSSEEKKGGNKKGNKGQKKGETTTAAP